MTEDRLIEFLKSQMDGLRSELSQTRSELKEVAGAMRQLELHLAKLDTENLAHRQQALQDRISKFEKQALTEDDVLNLRAQVAGLVTESTERKAQMRLLKGGLAVLSAVNLLLMIYLGWKRI